MPRTSSNLVGASIALALVTGIAACSGGSQRTLPTVFPNGGSPIGGSPLATPTPPVTAPVTIPYPYTNRWVTKTWTGATAQPTIQPGSDSGTITVKFKLDKKPGVYDVPETIKSKSGYTELLNSAVGFLPYKNGIAQIILSDNFTYVQGPLTQTGMDTYPSGQNSIDFPLTTGNRWSAAAAHYSYYNVALTGKGAFAQNVTTNEAANGDYTGQTSFSSTKGRQNQDNYASTTDASSSRPSLYTLSERAAGYNLLTQTFFLPDENIIFVRSSGKPPLPIKRGTVQVSDWYPHQVLPKALYADDWRVAGPATMPGDCGKRAGEKSTEVVEKSYTLDPVQGLYNTYTADYYLTSLASGQYWFACIVQDYTNTTYANAWIMNAGNWGRPSSQQIGKEILIAKGAFAGDASMHNLRAFAFTAPVALRGRLAHLGLPGAGY
jgi:hypothetical protein